MLDLLSSALSNAELLSKITKLHYQKPGSNSLSTCNSFFLFAKIIIIILFFINKERKQFFFLQ